MQNAYNSANMGLRSTLFAQYR